MNLWAYSVVVGLLIPWWACYQDLRQEFSVNVIDGVKVWLGISGFCIAAVLVLVYILRLIF